MTWHVEARRRSGTVVFRVWTTVSDTYYSAENDVSDGGMTREQVLALVGPEGRGWPMENAERQVADAEAKATHEPWAEERCGTCLDSHVRGSPSCAGWRD